MRTVIFIILSIFISINTAQAERLRLAPAIADTYITPHARSTPFGNAHQLKLDFFNESNNDRWGGGHSHQTIAFLKFRLNHTISKEDIISAHLVVFISEIAVDTEITVHDIDFEWDENVLTVNTWSDTTWNREHILQLIPKTAWHTWAELDITALAKTWIELNTPTRSFKIIPDWGADMEIISKEHPTKELRPYIQFTLTGAEDLETRIIKLERLVFNHSRLIKHNGNRISTMETTGPRASFIPPPNSPPKPMSRQPRHWSFPGH